MQAGAYVKQRASIAREKRSSLQAPLARLPAPSFLSLLRVKGDGFHGGATHVKRFATVYASEAAVAAQPMGACKGVTLAMGTGKKFHFDHVGQHRCDGLNEAEPIQ
jgi:hypothetical protein